MLNESDSLPRVEPTVKDFHNGWPVAPQAKEAQRGEHQAGSAVNSTRCRFYGITFPESHALPSKESPL